ncbi:MAG: 30S ribosomal protein S12 methylthiotransferase RimO [Clostridia bacterium]|nr:30S ribosomal protein S12 methylthiotransferase RimO [Clostridia bacterium]
MAVKVGMVSLGCSKNRVDGEMILYNLREAGFELVQNVEHSDVAIVNTCGFIEDAKKESIDEILELARLKKRGIIKAIIVTGCLAERYKGEVMKELYEVDAVVGIGGNKNIAEVISKTLEKQKTELFPEKTELPLCGGRVRSTPFYYSYLKIAEGCDNHCTYCAIPLIRGKFRSRPMEDILREAEELSEKGVKEFIIIAQDTSRYGEDFGGKSLLPELLRKLCAIEKLQYIRVLYCYPERITDELIKVMATEPKILKYIDIPMQHCNGRILKLMNRKGDRKFLTGLVSRLRKEIPGITIRTTLMTGFPGETKEEFIELSEFVEEMRFERMGCFAYSIEEDTPAAKMKDQLDEDIKRRRQEIIMEQQSRIMAENTRRYIGRTINVLCEGYDRQTECYFGRSAADAPEVDARVYFISDGKKPRIGDIIRVAVTDSLDCDLMGETVERIMNKNNE